MSRNMADQTIFDAEEWRPVVGWPDYEVSNLGRVRRATDFMKRQWQNGKIYVLRPKGVMLKTGLHSDGYPYATLYGADRKRKTVAVHILVCEAFCGPRPSPEHEVAHWDGNRNNPAASNLRWATRIENQSDRLRHTTDNRGERSGKAVLTEETVREIRAATESARSLAKRFGVAPTTIHGVRTRTTWKWLD